ncbi:MAG TPA: DUF4296 domain-containing protein [Flavipsychrobacter sp.]|nr:DUF4296 domain-containing protein [Flavipsychrobacter sp.]
MKLSFISLLLLLLIFGSCSKNEPQHLSSEKMQQIMLDVNLAEAYSAVVKSDSLKPHSERNLDSLAVFYRSVFQHYNVTKEQFEESLEWYKEHPEELDSVYGQLIPQMSKLEAVYP